MTDSDGHPWSDTLSGRERVRRVVETLDGRATVQEIADRAAVSWATADDELERLAGDDWVTETTVEGTRAYDLNPVRLLFDEITDLIADKSREELEEQLVELRAQQEELAEEYDAASLAEFRDGFADEELSAAELRERRRVLETWRAVETDLTLVRHALRLYDDVVELSSRPQESSSLA